MVITNQLSQQQDVPGQFGAEKKEINTFQRYKPDAWEKLFIARSNQDD